MLAMFRLPRASISSNDKHCLVNSNLGSVESIRHRLQVSSQRDYFGILGALLYCMNLENHGTTFEPENKLQLENTC